MEKNKETLSVLRHSASHIMAQAVQKLFPSAKLAIGPSTDTGFYYDFDLTDGHAFTEDDLQKIEDEMKNIIKQNLTFERYVIPDVDKQIAEFKAEGEIYKAELLEEHRNDNPTLYLTKDKDGNVLFNDLCAGPHIPNTSYIKGNAITRNIVTGESRKIAFRSDDYNLDSKCRFPQIQSVIDLDADEFIKAITDAIKAEQAKSGKSFEQSEAEQKAAEEKRMAEIAAAEEKNKAAKEVKEVVDKIMNFIKENKSNMSVVKPILAKCKELGIANPAEIDNLEDAMKVAELIK